MNTNAKPACNCQGRIHFNSLGTAGWATSADYTRHQHACRRVTDAAPGTNSLAVSAVENAQPPGATAQVKGTTVSCALPEGYEDLGTFSYTLRDGRGGLNSVQVNVLARIFQDCRGRRKSLWKRALRNGTSDVVPYSLSSLRAQHEISGLVGGLKRNCLFGATVQQVTGTNSLVTGFGGIPGQTDLHP